MPSKARSLLALALSLAATSPMCQANVGDTLDQATVRYGQPISHGKGDSSDAGHPWYVFKSGNFLIQQIYSGKTCWMEDWCKKDYSPMSPSEQHAILKANTSPENKWGEPKNQNGIRTWQRTDGATALYDPIRGTMTAGNDLLLTLIPPRKH